MSQLTAWQRCWMIGLITVWTVSVTLSGLQALAGWGRGGIFVAPAAGDVYPEVQGVFQWTFRPPEDALQRGDRLVRFEGTDLRGIGFFDWIERLYNVDGLGVVDWSRRVAARTRPPERSFEYLRDGELRRVVGIAPPLDRSNSLVWLLSFLWGAIPIFTALRAPGSVSARALLLYGISFSLLWTRFFFGSSSLLLAGAWIQIAAHAFVHPLALRWALLMPAEAAPRSNWPYLAIWLLLPMAVNKPEFIGVTGFTFGHVEARVIAWAATMVLTVVAIPVILLRNYRVASPVGRRQLRWILLAGAIAGVYFVPAQVLETVDPRWLFSAHVGRLIVFMLFPIALAVAILRFNLFDIDRVLSATASFAVAAVLLVVVAGLAVPYLGAGLGGALGLEGATGQLLVTVALAAVVLPSQRFVRPWVDRTFFRERVALVEGFDAFVSEVSAIESRPELLRRLGSRLEELLHPETVVVFASSAGSFAPAFAAGEGAAELEHERVLIEALSNRTTPLSLARGGAGRSATFSPFDRAALETLGADVVLPLRRGPSLDAFVSLGRKHSGDVYTATDLALLGSLADKVSLRLGALEGDQPEERHLAGIVTADVVGYSRLMSHDERATIDAIAAVRELVAGVVGDHHGRLVDFVGDNFLAEFPSALDAAGCALQIQAALAARTVGRPAEQRIDLRIGVHLGDVTARGDRIYGEGVNVAARLEALAEPGGICISATVHEQVEGKLRATHEDLGEREVKNIPRPVRVYRLRT